MKASWRLIGLLPCLMACPKAPLPLPEEDAAVMDAPEAAVPADAPSDARGVVDRPDAPATDTGRTLFCPTLQRLCGVSCRDVSTDPMHCGACYRGCSLPRAISACEGGVCTLAACREGYGNCDGTSTNGCETTTATDVNHCGVCGNRCAFAHAGASCAAGRCQRGACQAGFMDCNDLLTDGCETDVTTDAHCGGCSVACQAPGHCSWMGGTFACAPL